MSGDLNNLHEFGKCLLDSEKKVLWFENEPVGLPRKAVELLSILVERRGEVVTKDEIWQGVWHDAFVEETNLTHNIYLLRKTLKELGEPDVIQTVPRRGYRFSGETRPYTNGDLVIEKHSITRTLIEEVPANPGAGPTVSATHRPGYAAIAGVTVLALLAVVFITWKFQTAGPPAVTATAPIRSIAVLPLVSLNDGPDDRALSLGFTDALITSLGGLDEVRVVSARTATAAQPELVRLAKELAVDGILEGTFQKANGKLRVTLRLIRSADGQQIWSGSFDESEAEIFKLQDAMAQQTAAALSREARVEKYSTDSHEAYQAYLRGRYFFDKRTAENYETAIDEFTRAVTLDPQYALAYTGLADVYAMQANIAQNRGLRDQLYERARVMALKAVELDDASAEAHTSLGWIKRVHDWDWQGSEREFMRAIELDPNYANARQWYSFLLLGLGRMDESLAQMEKALELEPLSRTVLNNSIMIRSYRGDVDMLPAIAERVALMDDSEPSSSWIRSLAYSRTGQHAQVVEIGESYLAKTGGTFESDYLASNLAIAYSRTGNAARAAELFAHLEEKSKKDNEAAFRLAQAYAELGNKDRAITLLQQCLRAHDDRMVWIKTEPRFESLRSDPRYLQMLRELRL